MSKKRKVKQKPELEKTDLFCGLCLEQLYLEKEWDEYIHNPENRKCVNTGIANSISESVEKDSFIFKIYIYETVEGVFFYVKDEPSYEYSDYIFMYSDEYIHKIRRAKALLENAEEKGFSV